VLVTRRTRVRSDLLLPAVFAVVYVGVAVGIGPNLGYRHLLPVLPLAVLAAAVAGDALRTAGTSSGLLAWPSALKASLPVLLIGWTACATLTATPNELAYFNEIAAILVGSPRDLAVRKHELLISSNLDWGQGMKLLASYLATETDATIYVAYRHPAPYPMPADAYLVPHPDAEPMSSPFHPEPGRYLIGATSLHVPASCCGLGLDSYAYFRNLGPDDTVGDAILVYDIAPEDQPAWLIQCGAPVSPLADETVEAGLARAERLRRVQMDCSRTWLYPQGQGIYAFAAADPALSDPYVTRHLASTRLSYVQPAGFVPAPFRLYEIMGHPAANLLPASRVGRAAVPPAAQPNAARSHVVLDGNLEFLGLSVLVPVEDGANHASTLDISTWWRVVGPLPSEPLSVMAHVVTEDGQTLGVADGLGLLPSQLTVQDILVQRHSFAIPQSTSPSDLWLRTGIYALSDQVRWPVDGCPGCDAVFVSLDS